MKQFFVATMILFGFGAMAQIPIWPGPDTAMFAFAEAQNFLSPKIFARQELVFNHFEGVVDQSLDDKGVQFVPRWRSRLFGLGRTSIVGRVGVGLSIGQEIKRINAFEEEPVTTSTWVVSGGILFATWSGYSGEIRMIRTGRPKPGSGFHELFEARFVKNFGGLWFLGATANTMGHALMLEAGAEIRRSFVSVFPSFGYDGGDMKGGPDGFFLRFVIMSRE